MQVAVYVRVSTNRQAQTQTIEHQLERLRAHVQAQGWELPDEWVFRDDGFSGASLKRPGLDRLRDQAASGTLARVLVTDPDRLARKYVHQVLLLEELERYGCQVEFLDRPMSQDPNDQLLLQIRGAVAEYERSLITERMRRGRLAKYQAGVLLPWTYAPYGYRVHPDRPRDPATVYLDEAEAAIVADLFATYLQEDSSLLGLVKRLHDQGIASPRGKPWWGIASVRGLLTNPVYTGQVYANRRHYRPARIRRSSTHPIGQPHDTAVMTPPDEWIKVATVPAIVSQEDFDLVQAKLTQNQSFARRNNTAHTYLLRALVSCGRCQRACLARTTPDGYQYYTCSGKMKPVHTGQETKCPSRFTPVGLLDELVWQDLCEVLTHPDSLAQALERAHGGHWLPQELQARRENLRKGQRRRQDVEQRQQALDQQAQQLSAQVDRQAEVTGLVTAIHDFAQRIQASLAQASFEQKRRLVELLIDRVVVNDGEVEIRYVIPTSSDSEHIRFCHLRSDYLRRPDTVRRLGLELLVEDVLGHRLVVLRVGGMHEAARGLGTDGVATHEARDALVVAVFALVAQFGRDARAAIRLTTRLIHLADPLDQALVVARPLTGGTLAPGVVATRRDTHHPT